MWKRPIQALLGVLNFNQWGWRPPNPIVICIWATTILKSGPYEYHMSLNDYLSYSHCSRCLENMCARGHIHPSPCFFCHINLTQSVLWVMSVFMFSPISEKERERGLEGWTPQDRTPVLWYIQERQAPAVGSQWAFCLVWLRACCSGEYRELESEREEMTAQPHWSQVQDRGRGGGGGRENEAVCLTAEYSPSICCTSLQVFRSTHLILSVWLGGFISQALFSSFSLSLSLWCTQSGGLYLWVAVLLLGPGVIVLTGLWEIAPCQAKPVHIVTSAVLLTRNTVSAIALHASHCSFCI